MDINISVIITWLIVGALAGSLVGMVMTASKSGFGRWTNFGIGLVGAFIGGVLFRFFRIDLGLSNITVSLEDVVAAFAGAIVFIILLKLLKSK